MNRTIEANLRLDIGNIQTSIQPHWAYYIIGAIFIVFTIISAIFTYYYITHPGKKNPNESSWFKKFWFNNRIGFYIMLDIICLLSAILFMMNGS